MQWEMKCKRSVDANHKVHSRGILTSSNEMLQKYARPSVRLEPEIGRRKPIAKKNPSCKSKMERMPQASKKRNRQLQAQLFGMQGGSRPPNPGLQREQRKLGLCTNELY